MVWLFNFYNWFQSTAQEEKELEDTKRQVRKLKKQVMALKRENRYLQEQLRESQQTNIHLTQDLSCIEMKLKNLKF